MGQRQGREWIVVHDFSTMSSAKEFQDRWQHGQLLGRKPIELDFKFESDQKSLLQACRSVAFE